jgi:protein involved in polysaccharide export with SLBB domain
MSLSRISGAVVVLFYAGWPLISGAQSTPTSGSAVSFETRAQLEAEAKTAEAQRRTAQAFLLKTRLVEGDFREGDRIVVMIEGRTTVSDTMVVRAGKVLQFPRMSDLSLVGVLRSELLEKVRAHVAEYVREPEVRVRPLIRLSTLGRVARQGFYYISADVLLNDVIMQAGGPTPDADLQKIVIRRGGDVIWDEAATRTALNEGLSLDRLHLRAGDEITVGGKRTTNWSTIIQSAVTLLSLGIAITQLR